MAATMAPTIGAVIYSQALLKLPVAIIGPSARAGLKGAPVRAPPMMILRVSVIPIASGARLPARPATAVPSTTVTRKKASMASIMKPASGVIVTVVVPRARPCASAGMPSPVAAPPRTVRNASAPATPPRSWLMMYPTASPRPIAPAASTPIVTAGFMWPPDTEPYVKAKAMMARPWAKAIAAIPGRPTPLPITAAAPAPMNTKAKVPMNSAPSFGAIRLDIVLSRAEDASGHLGIHLRQPCLALRRSRSFCLNRSEESAMCEAQKTGGVKPLHSVSYHSRVLPSFVNVAVAVGHLAGGRCLTLRLAGKTAVGGAFVIQHAVLDGGTMRRGPCGRIHHQ